MLDSRIRRRFAIKLFSIGIALVSPYAIPKHQSFYVATRRSLFSSRNRSPYQTFFAVARCQSSSVVGNDRRRKFRIKALHMNSTSEKQRLSDSTTTEILESDDNLEDSHAKLKKIRSWMSSAKIDAFIVPSDDPHLSEYVSTYFNRREFISGFSGSAGTALITQREALLWTDGRYFLQAEQELSSSWNLMKAGQPGVLTISAWLSANVPKHGRVGIDPLVHSYSFVNDLTAKLSLVDVSITPIHPEAENPIDIIWGDARPPAPNGPLRVHPFQYAGETVQSKLSKIQKELESKKAQALVICALDEVAYLFNIRGSDIAHNPVALAYAIIYSDHADIFVDSSKLSDEVTEHLHKSGVQIQPYESAIPKILEIAKSGVSIWADPSNVNFAALSAVPKSQQILDRTPISMAKAVKNEAELAGMQAAHVRDGASLSEFLCWLEKSICNGEKVTEVDVDRVLKLYRASRWGFLDLSFETIAGFGRNGAIIHYCADPKNCQTLDTSSMFLLDSGAQYIDGTTDVTRTMHFGNPSEEEKKAYTLVLKGNIGVDTAVFPENTPGCAIDSFARRALWEAGMDYVHGTGHGVGAALNVHEGPHSISPRFANETPLKAGMIVSNEPGYYLAGKYGIRIENLLEVMSTGMRNESLNRSFNCFRSLTLVPIQKSLIEVGLMTSAELDWIDKYHSRVWHSIGSLVNEETRDWLRSATEPILR